MAPTQRIGALFAGYGGLELAVASVVDAEPAWCADIDPGAARILAHHYPGAPNLGDITAVDWTAVAAVAPVDILTGGWPCQPFSHAGRRLGAADPRALWPEVARAVRLLRPRHVLLENVAAIVTAGELARAIADLAALGYVGGWLCLPAAAVGAPHRRNRCFIVATDSERRRRDGRTPDPIRRPLDGAAAARRRPSPAADPPSDGWHEGWPESTWLGRRPDAPGRRPAAADARRVRPESVGRIDPDESDPDRPHRPDRSWGPYEPAIRRWETVLARPAPPPTEPAPRGGDRLSPRFVEWMMGLPRGWVTDVPGLSRNAQLKALGNGVVPQQAAAALTLLGAVGGEPAAARGPILSGSALEMIGAPPRKVEPHR